MEELELLLKSKKYKKATFKISKTNHLLVKAKINGVLGNFILDTGASNSCVGFEFIERFQLNAISSETTAAGAGGTGMLTKVAHGNTLNLGRWSTDILDLVIFDLSHVNEALKAYKAKPVQGIIGADVLIQGSGIVNYATSILYLK